MKLLSKMVRFTALIMGRGDKSELDDDAADMGTAFGLDSITIVDFDSTLAPRDGGRSTITGDWQRRTRPARL